MGEPVEVTKCVTSDLYVPAHAEIIIEGVLVPNVTIDEAPFGEYTGYRTSPREPRTVYRVKAITMRKNPIMAMSNMGIPTDEGQLLRSFSLGLEMDKMLRASGYSYNRRIHASRINTSPYCCGCKTCLCKHSYTDRSACASAASWVPGSTWL